MLRQRLVYGLPIVAAVVVAAVLLGPGQARPVDLARIYAAGSDVSSARMFAARRAEGQEAPLGGARVQVFVSGESSPRTSGETDPGGALELTFEPPVARGTPIRIVMDGEVIAEGPLASEPGQVSVAERPAVAKTLAEDVTVRVESERGALVPPFAERVNVSLERGGRPVEAKLELSAISADLAQTTITTGPAGRAALTLTPLAQPIMLSLEIRGDGFETEASASLSVEMSGMYIAPDLEDGRVSVLSPSPRERAFLSYYSPDGRLGGASVALVEDERGYFRGLAQGAPPAGTIAIVASAEATEKGRSTIAWPAPGRVGTAAAPVLGLALDGTRARVEAERRRVSRVRTLTVAGLSAVAALELALLLWTGRRERRRLARFADALNKEMDASEEHNAREGAGDSGGGSADTGLAQAERPRARFGSQRALIAVICALVVLSFAMVAALVLR
ncbi:MAG: hypothetical protein IPM79_14515 [Polyangiaceae bacterium]|nr:hypothetical protein [Polyangiaceae bacterium]